MQHEVLEAIADVFYRVDAKWRFTYVNARAEESWHRRREDLLGRPCWDEFSSAIGTETHRQHEQVMRSRVAAHFETLAIDSRWYRVSIYPAADGGLFVYFRDVTSERARSADALAQQLRIFDTTLSAVADFFYIFDARGRFLYANRALTDLLGMSPAAVIGRTFHELPYPTELATTLQRQIQCVFDSGAPLTDETPFTSPEGQHGFYEYIFRPVFSADRSAVEFVAGSTRDITVRKRSEANAALMGSVTEKLALAGTVAEVMATIGAGIGAYLGLSACTFMEVDEAEDKAHCEHEWHRADGPCLRGTYRIGEFLTDDFHRASRAGASFVVHDTEADPRADAARYAAIDVRAFVTVPIVRDGWRFLIVMFDSEPRAWRDDEVALVRELGARIWLNLERRRSEEALRISDERLQMAMDAGRIFSWEINSLHGAFVWSSNAERVVGFPIPTAAEATFALLHPDDFEATRAALAHAFATRGSFQSEYRMLDAKTGRMSWFQSIGAISASAQDGTLRCRGITQNIDERHAAEQVRERLLRAEQAARAEAERANAAKDQFLAVLSHELRTPLAPLPMSLFALGREPSLSAVGRSALALIERNLEAETRLIDDLLDVSRIVHGKLDFARAPVDLHELVNHAAEVCEQELGARNLRLQLCLDASEHRTMGDGPRLRQVFWNLLRNAIKFTPSGGSIRVSTQNATTRHFTFEVTDTGIGIEADAVTHIFDAFVQASAETIRRFGGLGLGLSIAKAIVDGHSGQIRAASLGPGCGATLVVELPLLDPEPAASSTLTQSA